LLSCCLLLRISMLFVIRVLILILILLMIWWCWWSAKFIERVLSLSENYQGTSQYQAPELYGESRRFLVRFRPLWDWSSSILGNAVAGADMKTCALRFELICRTT
jgi:hypothetical protein